MTRFGTLNLSCSAGALAALFSVFPGTASAETQLEPSRIQQIADWLPPKATIPARPCSDRQAWETLARTPAFSAVLSNAQELAKSPVPPLTDDLYLDFSRTGNRDRCQRVLFQRSGRLVMLALAEAMENKGRFLGPLTETIQAICMERTWVYPAHDGKLNNFYGRTIEMDLRATLLAWELSSTDCLLGDKLSPDTRRLLRQNVERRVLQPFRDMVEGRRPEISWLRATHNWNAVCLAGTVGAALALEDSPRERAWFVAAGECYIQYFLKSFTPDGYCSEGIGYWNYGFGHFLMFSETVRQATGGHLELLANPAALQPALFCKRAEILNGVFLTISDCTPGSKPDGQFVRFLSDRLGFTTSENAKAAFVKPDASLSATLLFSFLPHLLPSVAHSSLAAESPARSWFPQGGVLVCRPDFADSVQFAAALKGGNNAENHNHNDVGSFSVVSQKCMAICDPGAEVYTARTFGPHRYDSKVLNSFGHAVPVVAGQLQRTGAEARAIVLETNFSASQDLLKLDISSAYQVSELKRLERTFLFKRGTSTSLLVRDSIAFTEPRSFESGLVTWSDWKRISEHQIRLSDPLGSVDVQIDTDGLPFSIKSERIDEDVHTRRKPMRLGIELSGPIKEAVISLTITPAGE